MESLSVSNLVINKTDQEMSTMVLTTLDVKYPIIWNRTWIESRDTNKTPMNHFYIYFLIHLQINLLKPIQTKKLAEHTYLLDGLLRNG